MDLLTFLLLPIIVVLLIVISWLWPPNSPWAPWWRTKKNTARAAFKMAKVGKNDTVFELGSGEATALIVAAKEFGAKGVGVEIEPARFLLSKITIWRKGLTQDINLIRGDFFKTNISEATVVYVYLVPKTLDRLIPKFKKELKKGTPIISYKYEMNLPLKKFDKKTDLRLYII
jgi:hypothetical protein